MTQIPVSVDIEDTLRVDLSTIYEALGEDDVRVAAMPVPPELGELPHSGTLICLRRVGGTRESLVVDTHAVSLDVYTQTWGESIAAANRLAGIITMLPHIAGLSVQYNATSITAQPYELPDTSNPVLPRVRLSAEFEVKASIETL